MKTSASAVPVIPLSTSAIYIYNPFFSLSNQQLPPSPDPTSHQKTLDPIGLCAIRASPILFRALCLSSGIDDSGYSAAAALINVRCRQWLIRIRARRHRPMEERRGTVCVLRLAILDRSGAGGIGIAINGRQGRRKD